MIGRHPTIFGETGFETGWFFDDINKNWKDNNTKRQIWLREWFEVNQKDYNAVKLKSISGIDFFNNFMSFCTARENKKRWIENSPGNISHFDLIQDNWKEFKFIHSVRDYKDTYASWKTKNFGTLRDKTVHEFASIVKDSYRHIENYIGSETEFYTEVKYEDLVLDTENTLKKVINWLDEEWVDGMHIYEGSDAELQKCRSVIKKDSTTSQSLTKPIFTTSINQWHDCISKEEANVIDNELGFLAEKLGY